MLGSELQKHAGFACCERLPLEPDTWIRDLCARANRNFSLREWKLYVGTDDYRKTCPDLPKGEGVR